MDENSAYMASGNSSANESAENQFRVVVEGAPNAIVMIDARGRIVLANPQAEKLFGYTRAELLGATIERLLPQKNRARHTHDRATFLASPQARPMGAGRDLFGLRKDGSEVPLEIGLNSVNFMGETFALASIIDITARQAAEASLRASLQEKDVLLREVHHRVKNNLQMISSLLKLQSGQVGDPGARAILQDSMNRVHAIALVHEKLYGQKDLAQLDYGDYLRDLTASIARAFLADRSQIRIQVKTSKPAPEVACAVPIGVIVNELVSNSIKHAFKGGKSGRIDVVLSCLAPDSHELMVSDDGCGLPPGLTLESHPSMGLRLVGLLARQINGKLSWDNAPGARFRIVFNPLS
jgi:two-component system, sensor histidine kinase PdtaS